MIELDNVEKYYYDKLIIKVPRFIFQTGTTWISGINGSGKTTLLKIMAGMIPFGGDVKLGGVSVKKRAVEYRSKVSFAEAEPLYPSFVTGAELVEYYSKIRKASPQNVADLIAFSGLRSAINNPTGTYSSGMVKRLSLLLAFIGAVPFILLDEPLATLDAEAIETLPDIIADYRTRYGTSFVFSSHQPLPDALQIDRKLGIDNHTIVNEH